MVELGNAGQGHKIGDEIPASTGCEEKLQLLHQLLPSSPDSASEAGAAPLERRGNGDIFCLLKEWVKTPRYCICFFFLNGMTLFLPSYLFIYRKVYL